MGYIKGEWKVEKGTEDNGGGVYTISCNDWNIAAIWLGDGNTLEEEERQAKANAKLIEQAPKLLEELECFVEMTKNHPDFIKNEKNGLRWNAVSRSKKVIKNATYIKEELTVRQLLTLFENELFSEFRYDVDMSDRKEFIDKFLKEKVKID